MSLQREPLLDVQQLFVEFPRADGGSVQAVRGINLTLYPGETVAIVGESGCGKSSAAKAILRLQENALIKGSVFFEGRDLLTLSEREMNCVRGSKLGMIFQDPLTSLTPTMKIGEQIIEARRRHDPTFTRKQAEPYAIELLQKVEVPDPEVRLHHYPHMLSGGQRQRVMIALALSCRPKLLVADEPTTSLDVTIQAQILHTLKQMQREVEAAVLLITHDLGLVAQVCDRVLVMYAGLIVESADVETLFSSPAHPYTRRLLRSLPRLDQRGDTPLETIEGAPPDLSLRRPGCPFLPRCPESMRICKEEPPLRDLANDHKIACHLGTAPSSTQPLSIDQEVLLCHS